MDPDRIGAAPVSFGIFGGADIAHLAASPRELIGAMARLGYRGGELGPPGFFGTPRATATAFADEGLTIIGAYVPLHLSLGDDVMAADLEGMRRTLEELGASGASAVAILADEGDPGLVADPYRAPGERRWTADQWAVAADRLSAAQALADAAGIATSFHPHFGTYVEQADEIDTLLDRSPVALCLDTGHFVLGGADPLAYADRWFARINHVHLKDVRVSVLDAARARRDPDFEGWFSHVATTLGDGDVDLVPLLNLLSVRGYTGWLVVEQDRAAVSSAGAWREALRDQAANMSWLKARLAA